MNGNDEQSITTKKEDSFFNLLKKIAEVLSPRYTAVKREQASAAKFFQDWYSHPATISRMYQQEYSDEDIKNLNESIETFRKLKVEKELTPLFGYSQRHPDKAKNKIIYDIGFPFPTSDWKGYKAPEHIGIAQTGSKFLRSMKQPELRSVLTHEAEHWIDPKLEEHYYKGPSEAGIDRVAKLWSDMASTNPELVKKRFGFEQLPTTKKEWSDIIRKGQESTGAPYLNTQKDFLKVMKLSDPDFARRGNEAMREYYHYQSQNPEIRGRVMEIRRALVDQGLIDPSTNITPDLLRRVKSKEARKAILLLNGLFQTPGTKAFEGLSKLLNVIAGADSEQAETDVVFG